MARTIILQGFEPSDLALAPAGRGQNFAGAQINGHVLMAGTISAVRFVDGGIAIDLLPAVELRNDHGEACTCGACVMARQP